jgi:penicillin-binding protein 1A
VDTSEIQFDFSGSEASEEAPPEEGAARDGDRDGPSQPRSDGGRAAEPGVDSTTAADTRTARADREVPTALRTPAPPDENGSGNGSGQPPATVLPPGPASAPGGGNGRPQLKKLRLLFVIAGLAVLALVSTVFGMMMAVSQDLPAIYNFSQFRAAQNTVVVDDTGDTIGTLSSNQNKILLDSFQISQNVKNATVAIEDARFYQHSGVDFQGIARALFQDVLSRSAKQGASTITQQFVKNALEAQGSRTVFEKFREAALAYRLEQRWDKDKILTEYLNTIYFGEGAYGIEAAARTYFGWNHPSCGTEDEPCASVLLPHEAALLAGIISSPSLYDPKANPEASKERRDLVLQRMYEQGYITEDQYNDGVAAALPVSDNIEPPEIDSEAPYFTTWLRQQLVDKYGPGKAFFGGLKVKSTLDLELQKAAEATVYNRTAGLGITSSVVVIDNETGGVKAMIGGAGYEDQPFNIAAYGARQPGSSFKPFTLVSALKLGHSPYEVYTSAPKEFEFGKRGLQDFKVENYEDQYLGSASLISATQYSDNSVYAELGINLKKEPQQSTRYIARTAHQMGIVSPLSLNPAMILGGLERGVNTLEMAHAYETLAEDGVRVSGTLAPDPGRDPVAFTRVTTDEGGDEKTIDENDSIKTRVLTSEVAGTTKQLLANVVSGGTGTNAAGVSDEEWGKTGTTDDNGDAWFCGGTEHATACVWVGNADEVIPMLTQYGGQPVDGGTIPALIWRDVMLAWESIRADNAAEAEARNPDSDSDSDSDSSTDSDPYVPPAPTEASPAPAPSSGGGSTGGGGGSTGTAPATPAPAAPTPAPSGGGGVSAGGGVSPG